MKTTKTYSIEADLFTKFEEITRTKNINRSQYIEDKIREFVSENIELDISSKYEYNGIMVSIKDKKVNNNGQLLLILDDESVINYDLFKKHYTKMVNPESFFNSKKPFDALGNMCKTVSISNKRNTVMDVLSIPLIIDADNNKISISKGRFENYKNLFDPKKDINLLDEIKKIGYEDNIIRTDDENFSKGPLYISGFKWRNISFKINEEKLLEKNTESFSLNKKSSAIDEYLLVATGDIIGKRVNIRMVKKNEDTLLIEISGTAIEFMFDQHKNINDDSAIIIEPYEYFEIKLQDMCLFLHKYLSALGTMIEKNTFFSEKNADKELLETIADVTNMQNNSLNNLGQKLKTFVENNDINDNGLTYIKERELPNVDE